MRETILQVSTTETAQPSNQSQTLEQRRSMTRPGLMTMLHWSTMEASSTSVIANPRQAYQKAKTISRISCRRNRRRTTRRFKFLIRNPDMEMTTFRRQRAQAQQLGTLSGLNLVRTNLYISTSARVAYDTKLELYLAGR